MWDRQELLEEQFNPKFSSTYDVNLSLAPISIPPFKKQGDFISR